MPEQAYLRLLQDGWQSNMAVARRMDGCLDGRSIYGPERGATRRRRTGMAVAHDSGDEEGETTKIENATIWKKRVRASTV